MRSLKSPKLQLPDLSGELPLERIAGITRTLSVMLSAGLSPASAWKQVAVAYPGYEVQLHAAAAAATQGKDVAQALQSSYSNQLKPGEREAWQALAAAWWVGARVGANLAHCLRALSQSMTEIARCQREIFSALSGPRATAKFIGYLPLFSLVLGLLLGFNSLQILLFTGPGLLCAAAGVVLIVLGRRWNHKLLRSALPGDPTPGLDCELSLIALQGGGALDTARHTVTTALKKFQLLNHNQSRIEALYRLSERSGAPAGPLLQAEAELARTRSTTLSAQQAGKLSVRLLIPLGMCVLPAFILLGIVPLVASIFAQSFGG